MTQELVADETCTGPWGGRDGWKDRWAVLLQMLGWQREAACPCKSSRRLLWVELARDLLPAKSELKAALA